jgi:hypothetical protein
MSNITLPRSMPFNRLVYTGMARPRADELSLKGGDGGAGGGGDILAGNCHEAAITPPCFPATF